MTHAFNLLNRWHQAANIMYQHERNFDDWHVRKKIVQINNDESHFFEPSYTMIMVWIMTTMPRNMAAKPSSWQDQNHVFPTRVMTNLWYSCMSLILLCGPFMTFMHVDFWKVALTIAKEEPNHWGNFQISSNCSTTTPLNACTRSTRRVIGGASTKKIIFKKTKTPKEKTTLIFRRRWG